MKYDVLIVGAGPGGIFAAYELMNNDRRKRSRFLKQVILWKKENVPSTERK